MVVVVYHGHVVGNGHEQSKNFLTFVNRLRSTHYTETLKECRPVFVTVLNLSHLNLELRCLN